MQIHNNQQPGVNQGYNQYQQPSQQQYQGINNYNYPSVQTQPQYIPQQQQPLQGQPINNQDQQYVYGAPIGMAQGMPMKLPRTADGVRFPVEIECQFCRRNTKTRIEYKSGQSVCCCSCLLLFTIPILACIPCIMNSQKDVVHYCTQCNHQVGFAQKKLCE
ncbi:unnamed protein product [Paramecium primaurelia]|uniref:LITAF domain-containing protein n=1 Tax=Paramecium primaurelia TaxID=5886 RepID=A0A8S1L9Z5_PARPR|nr:unnamed protein product [Paramecium primaurelia]